MEAPTKARVHISADISPSSLETRLLSVSTPEEAAMCSFIIRSIPDVIGVESLSLLVQDGGHIHGCASVTSDPKIMGVLSQQATKC